MHKRLQAKTEEMDIQLEEFEEEREELQETINDLLMQVKLQKAQLEAFVAPNDLEAARNAFAWYAE